MKDQLLSYYKSPKDSNPVGIIPLDDIVNTAIYEKDSTLEYSWVFQILTKKSNNFLISCENETEMNEWIEAINFSRRNEKDLYESNKRFPQSRKDSIHETLQSISSDLQSVEVNLQSIGN